MGIRDSHCGEGWPRDRPGLEPGGDAQGCYGPCLLYTSNEGPPDLLRQQTQRLYQHFFMTEELDNTPSPAGDIPVSYTHLDVYKRQDRRGCPRLSP